jgi:hypothetical protein
MDGVANAQVGWFGDRPVWRPVPALAPENAAVDDPTQRRHESRICCSDVVQKIS